MAESRSKATVLVEALEELIRKETFCLKEENYEAVGRLQDKKEPLVRGLQELQGALRSEGERADLNRRLDILREQEQANVATLGERMKENREAFRKLGANAKSATTLLKTYGKPGGAAPSVPGGLKGKA